ncbi:MAG: restriction endonuclease [Chloroflexota bacterium]
MMIGNPTPRHIKLTEYTPLHLPNDALSNQEAQQLWQQYRQQIAIEAPSFKTDDQWRLTAQGWVGQIPLTRQLTLVLQPKVPLDNLFRMLEYAYNLQSFRFLDGLVQTESLQDFYQRLASLLAKGVLERARKGLNQAYHQKAETLPYVRGRLQLAPTYQTSAKIELSCEYEENSSDIEDNQILAWTLFRIARGGVCQEPTLGRVRRAYRALQGRVTTKPHLSNACLYRFYDRLNQDYRPLHALCHFFLEQSGPSHTIGNRTMIPFIVDMARLYEKFVAAWLKAHLPPHLQLKVQEKVTISAQNKLHFDMDLVVYDAKTGQVRYVLDTKYKASTAPLTSDIQQMITYAYTKKCNEAILIYPIAPQQPFVETIEGIRVRALPFSLADNLEENGQAFLEALFVEN